MTIAVHYFVVAPEKQETEAIVGFKNSKKGLYLFPRYEILVHGSDKETSVSKETYYSIEIGDNIEGYMRADRHFVTEDQIQMERLYFVPVLIFLDGFWFFYLLKMLSERKFVKQREKLAKLFKTIFKSGEIAILVSLLLAGLVMTILVVTNVYHKLDKSNLIEAEATVLAKDRSYTRSPRGSFSTYELLLLYSDREDRAQVTKKAVTRTTFKAYDSKDELTLFYRKNNVDDTFIQAESFNEVWPALVSLFTLIISLYFVSAYFILRAWHRERQMKKKNEEA